MNSLGIKKDDTVIVISGKEKGKKGKVIGASFKDATVIVEGLNLVKRHTKPRKQGEEGGIISKEAPIRVCKVMRVCPKCGEPTRTAWKTLDDGKKTRQCKKCHENI